MATTTSYNKRSSAVKRILSEARELRNETSNEYTAAPLEDNLFEWHFTLRGASGSDYEQGIYHGRIILPAEYPFRPPDVMILTPNGRWELNKKICLTFTGYHEEMWQPAWGIRTALIAVQAFMGVPMKQAVGIGSLNFPPEERRRLAKISSSWSCPVCARSNAELLPGSNAEARKQEVLPDGLTIDPNGGKAKGATEAGKAEGSSAGTETATTEAAAAAVAAEAPIAPAVSDGVEAGGSSMAGTAAMASAVAPAEPSVEAKAPLTASLDTAADTPPLPPASLPAASSEQLMSSPTTLASNTDASGDRGLGPAPSEEDSRSGQNSSVGQGMQAGASSTGQSVQAQARDSSSSSSQAQARDSPATSCSSTPRQRTAPLPATAAPAPPAAPAAVMAAAPAGPARRTPPSREEIESLRRLAALDRAIMTVVFLLIALVVRCVLKTTEWALAV